MRITLDKKFLIRATLSFFFFFMLGSKTFATTEFKLLASDGAVGDNFGDSVSINGDVALIGANGDDDYGNDSGSAYVFRWNGSNWVEEQKLLASDGAAGDRFGQGISISGDVALVAAPGSVGAYVFRWNGSNWVEEQKLLASDDGFGDSVSISGDVALLGASGENDKGYNSGAAFIFRWNGSNWVEEQKLLASDGAANDNFGDSVSISGDVALVGASEEEKGGPQLGKAYVFRWNGSNWVEEQTLRASDGADRDHFGDQVSISGDVALVGAAEEEKPVPGPGKAYVFRWNGSNWVEEQKLLASDGGSADAFGVGASVSGDVALVGAPGEDGEDKGSVYVFRWNGSSWVEEQMLRASDGAEGNGFGGDEAVSISGEVALVGADNDDEKGNGSGSAYVYALSGKCSFVDVPPGYWAEEHICEIYDAGITKGCSQDPLKYCPQDDVTRAQMAVFIGRGIHGSSFTPPPATGIFNDVPIGSFAANWIEQFYNDGITGGCGTSPLRYCPSNPVTRAQMAVFLLRAKHGSNYTPPTATGIFDDVPVGSFAADWIEQLYNEGITGGCGTNPLRYCPDNSVTRAQMAVFIVKTFDFRQ